MQLISGMECCKVKTPCTSDVLRAWGWRMPCTLRYACCQQTLLDINFFMAKKKILISKLICYFAHWILTHCILQTQVSMLLRSECSMHSRFFTNNTTFTTFNFVFQSGRDYQLCIGHIRFFNM